MKRLSFVASLLLMIGLVMPSMAGATVSAVEPGTLIKTADSSAVYYVDADLTRHAFPNNRIFNSWFADFGGVVVVSAETMASLPLGSSVPYKAGKRLVKITTDPRVYAVDDGGVLRWVKNEQVARDLYGAMWNKFVDDLPDSFFANYSVGDDVDDSTEFDADKHKKIKNISESLRAERLEKHKKRGGDIGSFENEGFGHDKIAVCHSFGDHGHTIYLAAPAKPAHMAHGDTLGRCASDESDDDEDEDEDDEEENDDDDAPTVAFTAPASGATLTGTVTISATAADEDGISWVKFRLGDTILMMDETSPYSVVLDTSDYSNGTKTLRAMARDTDGNLTETTRTVTFSNVGAGEDDETAPVISDVHVTNVTQTGAKVVFATDEDAKGKVYYSTANPVNLDTAGMVMETAYDEDHEIALTGLHAGTTYYVVVKAFDEDGNVAAHTGLSFTTLSADVTAPEATSATIDGVTENEAVVHVVANEDVKIWVYYSTVSPVDTGTADHEDELTLDDSHDVELTGLEDDTTYYVRIVLKDAAGNSRTLTEMSFTTDEIL